MFMVGSTGFRTIAVFESFRRSLEKSEDVAVLDPDF